MIADDFFTRFAFAFGCFRLHRNHVFKEGGSADLVSCDFSIVMQAKGFRVWVQWQLLDVVDVILDISNRNRSVNTRFGQRIVILKHVFVHVTSQNDVNQSNIFVICNTTTVINCRSNIVEHLVRHLFVGFNEDFKLSARHCQIFVCESVWDVPADWTELSAVLHDGVEESKTK